MAEKKTAVSSSENSGEIVLPPEVTEGKVWTYGGPTPSCADDSSRQGGRK